MKNSIYFLTGLVLAFIPLNGLALPLPVATTLGGAEQVGSTKVRVMFWDIYEISLYSPRGEFDPEEPFALRLQYFREIKGDLIAEKSVEEMRRQGISEVKLADWFVQMKKIFPDVSRGSELIGVFAPGQPTKFYDRTALIGQVLDPDFGQPFSRIWLGEDSSQPHLRPQLLGNESGS